MHLTRAFMRWSLLCWHDYGNHIETKWKADMKKLWLWCENLQCLFWQRLTAWHPHEKIFKLSVTLMYPSHILIIALYIFYTVLTLRLCLIDQTVYVTTSHSIKKELLASDMTADNTFKFLTHTVIYLCICANTSTKPTHSLHFKNIKHNTFINFILFMFFWVIIN